MEKLNNSPIPEVPQLNPENGISKDFINQFAFLITLYDFKGLPQVVEHLKNRPFKAKKYAHVYAHCRDVVTEKNQATVAKLDSLMLDLEEALSNPESIDENNFRRIINEAHMIIYGENILEI
jgi:hypothetical protein